MREVWKPIYKYENSYEVSNYGNIRSLDRYRELKLPNTTVAKIKGKPLKLNIRGLYFSIQLYKDGKYLQRPVHQFVAYAFIPNPLNKPQVNHKDGNKLNNNVCNLEWCTASENRQHAYDTGLQTKRYGIYNDKSKKVNQYDLNGNFIKTWESIMDIERELKISNSRVSGCCVNPKRNKTANGYIWKFEK